MLFPDGDDFAAIVVGKTRRLRDQLVLGWSPRLLIRGINAIAEILASEITLGLLEGRQDNTKIIVVEERRAEFRCQFIEFTMS